MRIDLPNGFSPAIVELALALLKSQQLGMPQETESKRTTNQNRPNPSTICGKIWAALDAIQASDTTKLPTLGQIRQWADANGINKTTARVQYYEWKKRQH